MKKLLTKITITTIMVLTLTNCSTVNRTHIGAISGGGSTTAACVAGGITDPYAVGGCAIIGAFAGAELLYNSDKDVHNAVFVDHLNTSPNGSSYTNWYNSKTGNSGIIHTTKSYTQGPLKCKEYDHTVDITNSWPLIGVGGVNRKVVFGTACQMPDGQWIEKPRLN